MKTIESVPTFSLAHQIAELFRVIKEHEGAQDDEDLKPCEFWDKLTAVVENAWEAGIEYEPFRPGGNWKII
jgi:hypothetical protein